MGEPLRVVGAGGKRVERLMVNLNLTYYTQYTNLKPKMTQRDMKEIIDLVPKVGETFWERSKRKTLENPFVLPGIFQNN